MPRSDTSIEDQVTEAVQELRHISAFVATLQQDIEKRTAKLQQLQRDHEQYSELAQIEAKKAEALLKQIEVTLGKEQRQERWIALAMHVGVGFLFFVLGVAVSDSFKAWMQHPWSLFLR